MLSNLSCLVSDRPNVMKKSNTLFNERREILFKEHIPAFSVYQIGEHLHPTFFGHLDLYSQQVNPNFRFPSEQIPLFFWINNVPRLEYFE
jgi:hypothetical protein